MAETPVKAVLSATAVSIHESDASVIPELPGLCLTFQPEPLPLVEVECLPDGVMRTSTPLEQLIECNMNQMSCVQQMIPDVVASTAKKLPRRKRHRLEKDVDQSSIVSPKFPIPSKGMLVQSQKPKIQHMRAHSEDLTLLMHQSPPYALGLGLGSADRSFNRTAAELERENAHFHISEALIAALEQMKCNASSDFEERLLPRSLPPKGILSDGRTDSTSMVLTVVHR